MNDNDQCSYARQDRGQLIEEIKKQGSYSMKRLTEKDYWEMDDVTAYLNYSKSTIYKLCCKKILPHFKLRKKLIFVPMEIRQWVYNRGVK